jgi:hypothetical protein
VTRSCGPCQVCCFAVETWELTASKRFHSPPFEACPHQCDKGCSIYERRPSCCARYRCLWLDGWGSDKCRPDRIGFVVEHAPADAPGTILTEARKGALKTKQARKALAGLLETHLPILVVHFRKPGDSPSYKFHGTAEQAAIMAATAMRRQTDGCLIPGAEGEK